MKLIVDIMGGDNSPIETLKGVCFAAGEKYSEGVEYILVGDEEVIKTTAKEQSLDISNFKIVHAPETVNMQDPPTSAVKEKKDSSMAIALHLLADGEGDALVSAGNTGALFTGASLIVRRLKGFRRAAICSFLPFDNPVILADSGANIVVDEDYLLQFAIMGSAYMKALYGIERPRVGLVNNGAEECKGTELQIKAYKTLSNSDFINFVGNVEGNGLPFGECDVAVCDGFTGNVVVKSVEGMGKLMMKELRGILYSNAVSKVAALMIKKQVMDLKRRFDPAEHGGAPILGISKFVMKAHGSSNAKSFSSAIRQTVKCHKNHVMDVIEAEAQRYLESKKSEKTNTVDTE